LDFDHVNRRAAQEAKDGQSGDNLEAESAEVQN